MPERARNNKGLMSFQRRMVSIFFFQLLPYHACRNLFLQVCTKVYIPLSLSTHRKLMAHVFSDSLFLFRMQLFCTRVELAVKTGGSLLSSQLQMLACVFSSLGHRICLTWGPSTVISLPGLSISRFGFGHTILPLGLWSLQPFYESQKG